MQSLAFIGKRVYLETKLRMGECRLFGDWNYAWINSSFCWNALVTVLCVYYTDDCSDRLLSAAPPRGEGSARHHALKCAGARRPAQRDCGPVERAHGALYTDYIWELWTRFPPLTQLVQDKYLLGRRRSCQTHFVHDSGSSLEGKAQRSLTSVREQVQQDRRKLQRSTHLGNGFTLPFAFDFNVCKPEGETLGGCKYLTFFALVKWWN